jgi:hypothetical protein
VQPQNASIPIALAKATRLLLRIVDLWKCGSD